MRIIHSRMVKVLTTPVSLYPHEWDQARQQILFTEDNPDRYPHLEKVADSLEQYRQEFDHIVSKLEKSGRYTLGDIVESYHFRSNRTDLSGFVEHLSHSLIRSGQERTARAYRTSVRALIRFNKGCDIPLKHINACLIKEFETHLKDCGKAMNTISYYMRMLRAIYWKAVRERLIESRRENPFGGVFTGFQQTRKRALDSDKLKELHRLDFSILLEQKTSIIHVSKSKHAVLNLSDNNLHNKGLYDCWRYFFFCFLSRGMSFVDMAYLRKENIHHGVISYYRKKTGQKIEITVTPSLQRIIDSFAHEVRSSSYLFPVIRDEHKPVRLQYESGLRLQNLRLKRLSCLAGICCNLSTHVSRHSWATIGKKQNLPLWVISEGLGHSSEKMTYTYLASFDRSTLDNANEQITMSVIKAS
jgi:integrase